MLNWKDLVYLFGRKGPNHPDFPDIKEVKDDGWIFESLTRGLGISGNPGAGKTIHTGGQLSRYACPYPNRPIVVYDASGALTNDFLLIVEALPLEQRETVKRRIVLDKPGHPNWVVPKPFFHKSYGLTMDEQVTIAVNILKELNRERIERTPIMATAINATAPELFRLLTAILDEAGDSAQIGDAKKLLVDMGLLRAAIINFGQAVPRAVWYLEQELLKEHNQASWESRIGALLTVLRTVEPDPLRAKYSFSRPGVTYREIIDNGLIYLVNGEKLQSLDEAQAWVFWSEFAYLRAVINQRIPHNPHDEPVLLVIDEVYKMFEIKGMAKALGQISTYYRARKLMPVIVIQAFWQLDDILFKQYWNLGNLITFQMDNLDDAYKLAQQLFQYEGTRIKFDAPREGLNPTAETDRGQYLQEANWIQNLGKRKMLMRRYLNEQEKEGIIAFVDETSHVQRADLNVYQLVELKEQLLKNGRAIHVKDALRAINARTLRKKKQRGGVNK